MLGRAEQAEGVVLGKAVQPFLARHGHVGVIGWRDEGTKSLLSMQLLPKKSPQSQPLTLPQPFLPSFWWSVVSIVNRRACWLHGTIPCLVTWASSWRVTGCIAATFSSPFASRAWEDNQSQTIMLRCCLPWWSRPKPNERGLGQSWAIGKVMNVPPRTTAFWEFWPLGSFWR